MQVTLIEYSESPMHTHTDRKVGGILIGKKSIGGYCFTL